LVLGGGGRQQVQRLHEQPSSRAGPALRSRPGLPRGSASRGKLRPYPPPLRPRPPPAPPRQLRAAKLPGIFVFIAPPSLEELERRLQSRRAEGAAQLQRRLGAAKGEITSLNERGLYDYLLINDNLEATAAAVQRIAQRAALVRRPGRRAGGGAVWACGRRGVAAPAARRRRLPQAHSPRTQPRPATAPPHPRAWTPSPAWCQRRSSWRTRCGPMGPKGRAGRGSGWG
jgi:hypothetical protein